MSQSYPINYEEMFNNIKTLFNANPVHTYIGIKLTQLSLNEVRGKFNMKNEIVGNEAKQILHGGLTSTVLDSVGGMMGIISAVEKHKDEFDENLRARLQHFGTISLHVDFLTPGRGEWFEVISRTTKCTNRIAFVHSELINDSGELIAISNNSYYYP